MADGRLALEVEAFRAVLTLEYDMWADVEILEQLTLTELADVKQAADHLSRVADRMWHNKHDSPLGTAHGR